MKNLLGKLLTFANFFRVLIREAEGEALIDKGRIFFARSAKNGKFNFKTCKLLFFIEIWIVRTDHIYLNFAVKVFLF